MALVFHRSLTIPIWAVAFCAVALSTPSGRIPALTVAIALAIIASMTMAMTRSERSRRVFVEVRPLRRWADRQALQGPLLLTDLVPGAREPSMLTTFETSVVDMSRPDDGSSMDAVTTAERKREGGGAASQRRPPQEPWSGRHGLYRFVTAARGLFFPRFRINHV